MGKKNNSSQYAVPSTQQDESTQYAAGSTQQEAAAVAMPGTESYQGLTIVDALKAFLDQVDPELRTDNPVWHWALCDDHCTFVFRDGRKTVISIQ